MSTKKKRQVVLVDTAIYIQSFTNTRIYTQAGRYFFIPGEVAVRHGNLLVLESTDKLVPGLNPDFMDVGEDKKYEYYYHKIITKEDNDTTMNKT